MNWVVGVMMCIGLAMMANERGYNPIIWFFAGGFIGYIVMIFLPNLNKSPHLTSVEIESKRSTGNNVGLALDAIFAVLTIGLLLTY